VTFDVNTEDIYHIERIFLFYGGSGYMQCNDYVCILLRIQVNSIAEFLGGRYLFQIWKNKERLF
jgi:hypothetical protein